MSTKTAEPRRRAETTRRAYLSQGDVPSMSIDDALKVPRAIMENYAGAPIAPLKVSKALNIEPKGARLKMLCGASLAYGLIDGGAQANEIALTDLAKRILKPLKEGDDEAAKREALLRPRVIGEFLRRYNTVQVPREDIARNVLEDLGVPKAKTEETLNLIIFGAERAGFIQEIKGKKYIDLSGAVSQVVSEPDGAPQLLADDGQEKHGKANEDEDKEALNPTTSSGTSDERRKRVFITHGKNRAVVEPMKKLLRFGELEAVVSVETQSVARPVSEKVMNDMRSCGAAIIHVDAEQVLPGQDGHEHLVLNPNVLIEIGAAMAFYGRRFILLVKDRITLPSNLQGLYEVRYQGETIDGDATIRLLEAINDIKNHPLP